MTPQESPPSLLLTNARVVLPDRVAEGASLLINNGQIASVNLSGRPSPSVADSVLSLEGLTIFPGFIDAHIHGSAGVDVLAANTEDLKHLSRFLTEQGITGWMPTFVPAADEEYGRAAKTIGQFIAEQDGGENSSSRALGIHYEGPFVSHQQCGALHTEHFQTFSDPGQIDSLPLPTNARCRLMTVAPEIEGGLDLIRVLKQRGWIVSIGHTRANLDVLDQAWDAGARHMTHFMNAMAPMHHRSPGPVAWGLSRDDVTCDFIADGIHLDSFMLKLLVKLKGRDRLVMISDGISAAGMGDGEYDIWGETITVKNGRTSNARGSIAGSVITMLDAVKMMLSLGTSEIDVAYMAATNPARLLGIERECGSIEEGKRADLVALDQRGDVAVTLVGGTVTHPR